MATKSINMRKITYLFAAFIILFACSKTTDIAQKRIIHELNEKEIRKGDKIIAIVGATAIDGNGGEPLQNALVVVKNEKIEFVGKVGERDTPKDAEIVDGKGLTLLPGLIDAHYHNDTSQDLPPLFLSHGITSVRDPGAWIEFYDSVRATGRSIPRLFLTGPHFDTYPPAYPNDAYLVLDPEEARLAVHKFARKGSTAFKVYFRLPMATIKQVCTTAHEYGLPVTGHLEIANAMDAINAGLDGIEHITSFGSFLLPAQKAEKYRQLILSDFNARKRGRYEVWNSFDFENNRLADSLIRFLADKKTFVTPTLAVFEMRNDKGDSIDVNGFRNMVKFTGKARKGGVRIVVGSHSSVPYADLGFAYFREMELLHEAGLSNLEIITAATMENARFFRIEERLGSVEKGKLADLILVEGDPLKDISAMRKVKKVMLNGIWVPAASQ